MQCELCGCDDELNFHHLIPKFTHSKKSISKKYTKEYMNKNGVMLCKHYCHPQIHKFYSEKELATNFNTLELLKQDEQISKYVKWRVKQTKNKKKL